jgi:tetratricopeptide (TPR) repeat protein
LALIVARPAPGLPQGKLAEAQNHNNQGIELNDKGQLDAAIAEFREAVRLEPDFVDAHFNLGSALDDKGDFDGAISEYRAALRLNPKNERAHRVLGVALAEKNDWDGEISEEREAIRLNPTSSSAHEFLGVGLGKKGNWDGEIAEEREAIRLNPKSDTAHQILGEALGAKGDVSGEFDEEREALRLNPKNENARRDLNHGTQGKSSAQAITKEEVWTPGWSQFMGIFVFIGFAGGLYSFIRGLLMFREFRVMEDTPEIPIRSIAMGLSHVHGEAGGEQTVPGPVSKRPCYFYEVEIEIWATDSHGKNGRWAYYATHADGVRFYLADATGKVLVDAHGAELDLSLLDSVKGETWTSRGAKVWRPNDKELGAYIERAKPGSPPGQYHLRERAILPKGSYDVIGTCVENPRAVGDDDRNLIMKGQNEETFMISYQSQKQAERTLRRTVKRYVFWGAGVAIICLVGFFFMVGWI